MFFIKNQSRYTRHIANDSIQVLKNMEAENESILLNLSACSSQAELNGF